MLLLLATPILLLIAYWAVAGYVLLPLGRRFLSAFPERWRDPISLAPIMAICATVAVWFLAVFIEGAPREMAILGVIILVVSTIVFIARKGWRGGWREALKETVFAIAATTLNVVVAILLFEVVAGMFRGGGRPYIPALLP